jgi:hypothetical protein
LYRKIVSSKDKCRVNIADFGYNPPY